MIAGAGFLPRHEYKTLETNLFLPQIKADKI
jgi:hypothetical protein